MNIDLFLAPLSVNDFRASAFNRSPLVIRGEGAAAAARRALLTWDHLSTLLAMREHWTADRAQMVINSRPVAPEHVLESLPPADHRAPRAEPAKIRNLLALGASLVANQLEDVCPTIRDVARMLGDRFAAFAGANAYASSPGVQAFASHCDLHDVFAVQTEGSKRWRVYANRAADPVRLIEGPDAQAIIDAAKGPVMLDVELQPGDMLYIPRGFFHDAIATENRSLHLTFSVLPLTGADALSLAQALSVEDPLFRAYLAPQDAGDSLEQQLKALGEATRALLLSARFRDALVVRQRQRIASSRTVDLSHLESPNFFETAGAGVEVADTDSGAILRIGGREYGLDELGGGAGDLASWALDRAIFSREEMAATFAWTEPATISGLLRLLQDSGAIRPSNPSI